MMKQSEAIPDGWRVASLDDVSKYRQKAHSAINLQWAICTLDDGKITGPGYNYETEQGCFPNLGHKLAINSNVDMTGKLKNHRKQNNSDFYIFFDDYCIQCCIIILIHFIRFKAFQRKWKALLWEKA